MIELRDVKKSFGAHRVLDGVTFRIKKGESVVIIGRSGGGKSILLKHLIGLLQPDSGDVLVEGQSIARMSERQLLEVRRKFGMLFQSAALFDSLTVAENVSFVLRHEGKLTPKVIEQQVEDTLDMVALPGTGNKKPAELSGGMRKRVGLARAIIYHPQIVLYDEPTTGLDLRTAETILHLLAHLNQHGMTVLLSSHDLNAVAAHLPWVICLNRQVIAEGPPERVFTEEILNRTYRGDMLVVRQDGMLLVQQRPHPHTVHDILPDPVLGHTE